jgi:hypothetical protein
VTSETLTLEPGERGEIVLCPDLDTRDPLIRVESSDDFVVEDVLLENLPAPSVQVSDSPRRTWAAKISNLVVCPDRPLKILVRNTGSGKITLRASLHEENQ